MGYQLVIVFLVAQISLVLSQGFIPPGIQFNPFFNSENPFNPIKNVSSLNPFPGMGIPQPSNSFIPSYNPNPVISQAGNPFIPSNNPYPAVPQQPSNAFNPSYNPYPGVPSQPANTFNPSYNPYPGRPPFANPFIPQKNFSSYNPFFTFIRPQAPQNPNGASYWNFWSKIPYFTNYMGSSGGQFGPRALLYQPYQPQYAIPDYYQCNGSHSLALGVLTPWDRVLFRQSYEKPARWYSSRQKYIYYPGDLPLGFVRNETITAIRIQDKQCNGTGGYAQVLPNGGIGHRNVTIRLYSAGVNKGFNFYVQIFGR